MVLPISILTLCLTLASACSSDSESEPKADAAVTQDAGSLVDATGGLPPDASANQSDAMPLGPDADVSQLCAEPGAVGNNQGVGQYCQTNGDCGGAASLCTVVQRPQAPPFCTKVCFGIGDECGDNATCDGDGVLMGCVPNCVLEQ